METSNTKNITITSYFRNVEVGLLPQVDFSNENLDLEHIKCLVSYNLTNVKRLFLDFNKIGDQGVKLIVAANLPNLNKLWLQENKITSIGAKFILEAKWPCLKELDVRGNEISSNFLKMYEDKWPSTKIYFNNQKLILPSCLRGQKIDSSVKKLDFYNSRRKFDDKDCLLLIMYDLPNLEEINLRSCNIGNDGAVALGQGNWPKLTVLYLNNSEIGDDGAVGISKGCWPNLNTLYIKISSTISDIGGIAISKANWPNLTTLHIYGTLSDTAAIKISKANWPKLTTLYIYGSLFDTAANEISKANWSNLTTLFISGSFTNIGKAFSKGQWPLLTSLSLNNGNNCESSFGGLLEGNWPNLYSLYLRGSISPSVVEELSNSRLEKLKSLSLLDRSLDNKVNNNKYGEALSKGIWEKLISLTVSNRCNLSKLKSHELQSIYVNIADGASNESLLEEWCAEFVKAELPNITRVYIRGYIGHGCSVSDKGVETLLLGKWQNLKELSLYVNKITEKGANSLTKANWPELQILDLSKNNISSLGNIREELLKTLKEKFPRAKISL